MESSNSLILTFGALSLSMLLIGILLLFCLVKVVRILNELNIRMQIVETRFEEIQDVLSQLNVKTQTAETKFEEIQGKLKNFTEDIGPFFSGGRELIDDIIKSKREAETAKEENPES